VSTTGGEPRRGAGSSGGTDRSADTADTAAGAASAGAASDAMGTGSALGSTGVASGTAPVAAVIIGAGPAGLAAAYELARLNLPARVFERDLDVGGLARTAEYRGYRFDIGGHRFFTKSRLVSDMWREILGDQLLLCQRLSRIYYRGRFFDYPLKPWRALAALGPWETLRIAASYAVARLAPSRVERTFEQWIVNRFGRRLFEVFFKTYTEKVWGIPCSQIDAAWAAQRIKNLDLWAAVRSALPGGGRRGGEQITTLIERFHYPRLGPGQMWRRCSELAAAGGAPTRTGAEVLGVHMGGGHGGGGALVTVRHRDGTMGRVAAAHVISSMPIGELLAILDPPPPAAVLAAGRQLRYRDFLTVLLIVRQGQLFPDNWIYIHAPEVRVGRVQNFKNWSADLVPDPGTTALGCEYFLSQEDPLWREPDAALIDLASRELAAIGLVDPRQVVDGAVVRSPKAYPVYDPGYRAALATIRSFLDELPNLHLVGRNGQHRYNNQDHSMLTGIYAARNVAGAAYDLWSVNADAEYHEGAPTADRLTPAIVAG
jgi:protoporphyrinogen oxidase